MVNPITLVIALLAFLVSARAMAADNYAQHPEAQKWIAKQVALGFDRTYLESTLEQAVKQNSILAAMDRPAERRLDWGEYRKLFIKPNKINRGVIFWLEHEEALARAEREYGVPAELIVSIIGVETHFGRNMGSYRALDALATLSFDYPRRAEFFQGQLHDLFLVCAQEKCDVTQLKSSYAGAMGYGQFMPSSFLAYAVDFDHDGDKDIWNSADDAIGSVANYFKQFGWQYKEPVVVPAQVTSEVDEEIINTGEVPVLDLAWWRQRGVLTEESLLQNTPVVLLKMMDQSRAEYLLGLNNFYVITRYNRSRLYAMAVYQLSQAISAAKLEEEKG